MKLFKVRNSVSISKVLIGIILFSFSTFSSSAQFYPQSFPMGTTGYPTNGYPTGTYQMGTQYPAQTTTPTAYPEADGIRALELTDQDQDAITHEDSIRAAIETEESEDLELMALRRKIFGYKLFNLNTFDPNSVLNIPTPNNYVLGANDHLIIDIYGYAQNHQEVVVDADGYISINNAGIVKVNGSTIAEATLAIKRALSRVYVRLNTGQTKLRVSLGDIRTIKVTITGEAVAPGTYTMSSMSTLFNALYRSGGPNEIGSFRAVKLIRGNKIVSTLDLYDILLKGFSNDNLLLQDQDVILIPSHLSRVSITGNTKREGLFELLPKEKLGEAINFAGGFGPDAYTHRLKVYRNTSREREIIDVVQAKIDDFEMETGDNVMVEQVLERFANLITLEGEVFRPGEYSLTSNPTLSTLIETADGLRKEAHIGRVSIVRTNDDLSTRNIAVNYKDILSGKAEDVKLQREDLIIIPSIYDLTEVAYIRIQGAINNPEAATGIEFPYIKDMTLEDILIRVGGLTEGASLSRVEISRRKRNVDITQANAQISEIIKLEVTPDLEVIAGNDNIVLKPFDEIFVRSSPNYQEQTFVQVNGEVFYPSVYGIESKEERISDIIKRAGGLTLQAYIPGATLLRTVQLSEFEMEQRQKTLKNLGSDKGESLINVEAEVEDTREETIDIDLAKIISNPGSSEDITLRDGDILRIPKVLETVRVQGEVLYPTTIKFRNDLNFKDYITGSGGFTKESLKKRSYVLYPNGKVDRTRRFLVFSLYPKIEPGSEIIVPQKSEDNQEKLLTTTSILNTISTTLVTLLGTYFVFKDI